MTVVTLSLISHTNVGKTTLARTLLRRDIGEVRDQAHVTEVSEAHPLIESGSALLRLWDTPGFGDTRRLLSRLRRERDPLGWFLHQVWDRVLDRPLWCSQQAVRNVRDEADVVLYLVNASEEPASSGYVALELELLTWMGVPVLLLLNQTGGEGERLAESWREFARAWPVVRDVLALDAFSRCWTEEGLLLERAAALLDGGKRDALRALAVEWNRRNLEIFRFCCELMGRYLARAAVDRERADPRGPSTDEPGTVARLTGALRFRAVDRRRAMAALGRRLDETTHELMRTLISKNGLEGESEARIEQRVRAFQVEGGAAFDARSGALAGAVVSGALGGLAADMLAGGLSLGGGMIAGGILGALGGSALAAGYRWIGGDEQPGVGFAPEFLDHLARQVVLRYLTVAHFGRGRGRYRDLAEPVLWARAVDEALAARHAALHALWKRARNGDPAEPVERLTAIVESAARAALRSAHPHAARLLA